MGSHFLATLLNPALDHVQQIHLPNEGDLLGHTHCDEGPFPLVEPMNQSASNQSSPATGQRIFSSAGARFSGGMWERKFLGEVFQWWDLQVWINSLKSWALSRLSQAEEFRDEVKNLDPLDRVSCHTPQSNAHPPSPHLLLVSAGGSSRFTGD